MTRLPEEFLTRPLAHRGLHDIENGRAENSASAFAAAMDQGFGIETDLQLSRDGHAMVFHDYALDRLTDETGAIRQRDAADLRQTRLKGTTDCIPDLPQLLEQVAGRVPILIELKDQDGAMGPMVGELEAAVAGCLRGYDGLVAVMSFNPFSVMELAGLCPDVPRGLVTSAYRDEDWPLPAKTCEWLRQIPDYDRAEASFISHEVDDLDRPRVAELAAAGADILCWTVRSADQEAEARKIAQNITFEGYLPR